MREIKFRAWDKYSKTMLYDFIIYSGGSWFDKYSTCCDTYHCGAQEYGIQRESSIDKNLIMQFTGLKDKNGKEVYEGDIFQRYNSIADKTEFLEICYAENLGAFWVKGFGNLTKDVSKHFEVIGNIYENPEVLK